MRCFTFCGYFYHTSHGTAYSFSIYPPISVSFGVLQSAFASCCLCDVITLVIHDHVNRQLSFYTLLFGLCDEHAV
jgi:hypothetical protein